MPALLLGILGALLFALIAGNRMRPHPTSMSPHPRTERRALQRSVERANAVAKALGFVAEQDAEIPTTFRLHAPEASDGVTLRMGSPAVFAGSFKEDKLVDWMKLEAKGPPGFPAGVKVRPPVQTSLERREGLPGESPTLVTPGGVKLVIENEAGAAIDIAALTGWIDSFPKGTWLVTMNAEALELRADTPAAEDAITCARMLLEEARKPRV
ncbi:hypothetical protein [Polyangium jinanense]|uniref:Uncharacterized protein n=1 Tax=Polyangium jinanense TaxID=2829994 RepID=A0A9X3WXW0_9BACT|nr:hypothetical protein [Polyangium jinanense]MDC3952489.1 hypothetical protein [Polyangium jinanense]MDC3980117.1 hypothetical protein [Polyangium jinanense]